MKTMIREWFVRFVSCRWVGIGVVCVFMSSCTHYEESGLPGSASSLARDRMMLVRKDPATFGSYRMQTLMESYPEIGEFVKWGGMPDFLAETRRDQYEYLIFYYLKRREAHACKVSLGGEKTVEFSGPYPITASEYKVLDGFRKSLR